jgi:hypothetical protein
MNLTLFKGKQVGAKKGYDLLKKKADALKVRILLCISLVSKSFVKPLTFSFLFSLGSNILLSLLVEFLFK